MEDEEKDGASDECRLPDDEDRYQQRCGQDRKRGKERRHLLLVVSLRTLLTLPLLFLPPCPLYEPLLVTLIRFLAGSGCRSSSFLGGMFSLPLPNLRSPNPKPSQPPFGGVASPPLAPAAALICAGDAMTGADCVRCNMPAPADRVLGPAGRARPLPPFIPARPTPRVTGPDGAGIELDAWRAKLV